MGSAVSQRLATTAYVVGFLVLLTRFEALFSYVIAGRHFAITTPYPIAPAIVIGKTSGVRVLQSAVAIAGLYPSLVLADFVAATFGPSKRQPSKCANQFSSFLITSQVSGCDVTGAGNKLDNPKPSPASV